MKVEWAPRALHEWENTVRYIYREFGRNLSKVWLNGKLV